MPGGAALIPGRGMRWDAGGGTNPQAAGSARQLLPPPASGLNYRKFKPNEPAPPPSLPLSIPPSLPPPPAPLPA